MLDGFFFFCPDRSWLDISIRSIISPFTFIAVGAQHLRTTVNGQDVPDYAKVASVKLSMNTFVNEWFLSSATGARYPYWGSHGVHCCRRPIWT